MKRTVNFELSADEAKQIQAEMRAQIAEMQRMNERIRKHQAETARLQIRMRATLDEIAEMLKTRRFSD